MLVLEERGKPEFPEKTSRSRVENQQTQPTYDAGSGNRTRDTLVEGEGFKAKIKIKYEIESKITKNNIEIKMGN